MSDFLLLIDWFFLIILTILPINFSFTIIFINMFEMSIVECWSANRCNYHILWSWISMQEIISTWSEFNEILTAITMATNYDSFFIEPIRYFF